MDSNLRCTRPAFGGPAYCAGTRAASWTVVHCAMHDFTTPRVLDGPPNDSRPACRSQPHAGGSLSAFAPRDASLRALASQVGLAAQLLTYSSTLRGLLATELRRLVRVLGWAPVPGRGRASLLAWSVELDGSAATFSTSLSVPPESNSAIIFAWSERANAHHRSRF